MKIEINLNVTGLETVSLAITSLALAVGAGNFKDLPKPVSRTYAGTGDEPDTATGTQQADAAETPTTESTVVGVTETVETPAPAKRARRTKAEIETAKTPSPDDEGAKNKAAIDAKLDAMRAQPTTEAPAAKIDPAAKTDLQLREEIRGIYRKKVELDPSFKAQYPVILSEVNEGVAEKLDNLTTDKLLALIEKLS